MRIGDFEEAFAEQYTDAILKNSAYKDDRDEPWNIASDILNDKFHGEDGMTQYPDVRAVEEALTGQINAYEKIIYDN